MVIKLDDKGLVPAILQHVVTDEVIMLGYMSRESVKKTLESEDVWFYSRSRTDLWHKGETSGNYMKIKSANIDCDGDALLLRVDPSGPGCHTGTPTCFFTTIDRMPEFSHSDEGPGILQELFATIQDRKNSMPEDSYTSQLFREGVDRISQKVVEEAGEVAIAGVKVQRDSLVNEVADLMYHVLVLLSASDVKPEDVWKQLRQRQK